MNLDDQEPTQQCQLCNTKVNSSQTYAGTFNRTCRKCYDQQIDDLQTPIHKIAEGIYVGNQKASRNQELLKNCKIQAICVCGSDLKLHEYQQIKVERKVLKILDTANEDIYRYLQQTADWINEMRNKNRNVLIHCAGGVSRSATICISYFMKTKQIPFQQSYILVKKNRKCIKPNQNFVKQMKRYQKYLGQKQ